jgi:hypothetical protein
MPKTCDILIEINKDMIQTQDLYSNTMSNHQLFQKLKLIKKDHEFNHLYFKMHVLHFLGTKSQIEFMEKLKKGP